MNHKGRIMTKRVPVSDQTHIRIRDLAKGLDTTMDDAINFLIDLVAESDDALKAGKKLRVKLAELRTADDDKDK